VRGRLCHILSFVVGKCFWHFARPAIYDSQLLDQNRDFCLISHLHSTPPLGEFPSEYRHPVSYGKTRMVWLPDGAKISKICLFVLTWSTNVTDGQTDGHTDIAWRHRPRLCIASRGKNYNNILSRFHVSIEYRNATDGQTELLYQYCASVCWLAIKTA